jgi:GAF domain-containing protein
MSYSVDLITIGIIMILAIHVFKTGLERANLQVREIMSALQTERDSLESRVKDRTLELTRQTDMLKATSYIARQIASIQELDSLLSRAAEMIAEQFGYYHVGIFILNESKDQAILQASSSEIGRQMAQKQVRVDAKGDNAVSRAMVEHRPRIAYDIGEDAGWLKYPEMPNTRSQIALPLIMRDEATGILDIHSTEPKAFTPEDINVFTSLADHLAIAIENARLFNETRAILTQMEALTSARTEEAWRARLRKKSFAYTYTPMGVRPEKHDSSDAGATRVAIALRGVQIGAITLARKQGEWSEDDLDLVKKIAGQVGLAADNLRLLEDAQAGSQRDQLLSTGSNRIRSALDMDTIVQTAVREFQRAMGLKEVEIRVGKPDIAPSSGKDTLSNGGKERGL